MSDTEIDFPSTMDDIEGDLESLLLKPFAKNARHAFKGWKSLALQHSWDEIVYKDIKSVFKYKEFKKNYQFIVENEGDLIAEIKRIRHCNKLKAIRHSSRNRKPNKTSKKASISSRKSSSTTHSKRDKVRSHSKKTPFAMQHNTRHSHSHSHANAPQPHRQHVNISYNEQMAAKQYQAQMGGMRYHGNNNNHNMHVPVRYATGYDGYHPKNNYYYYDANASAYYNPNNNVHCASSHAHTYGTRDITDVIDDSQTNIYSDGNISSLSGNTNSSSTSLSSVIDNV